MMDEGLLKVNDPEKIIQPTLNRALGGDRQAIYWMAN